MNNQRSQAAVLAKRGKAEEVRTVEDDVEFAHELMNIDFIIVEEFFPGKFSKEYESHGLVALNHRYVGKVKEWDRKQ